jgi:hypothetical protein
MGKPTADKRQGYGLRLVALQLQRRRQRRSTYVRPGIADVQAHEESALALRFRVRGAVGFLNARRLRHNCSRLVKRDGRLAVVPRGMDQGVDFGRGPQQAGLADPTAGAVRLAPVPKPNHDDYTSSAGQITHCRQITTLIGYGRTSGCSPEPWLPPPFELVGLA